MPAYYKECIEAWYRIDLVKKPKVQTVADMLNRKNQNDTENILEVKYDDTWRKISTMSRAELNLMLRGPQKKSKHENKWETKFEDISWKMVYKILTQKAIPRKIRTFHWKTLNSAVSTEGRLKLLGLSNGMCVLCGGEVENSLHLLVDCDLIKEFWKCLIAFIKRGIPTFQYKEDIAMLGCTTSNSSYLTQGEIDAVNFIVLNAKWIIWKRRCTMKYDNVFLTEDEMWNLFVAHLKSIFKMSQHIKSVKTRKLLDLFIEMFQII